jgi:hypothetical protein
MDFGNGAAGKLDHRRFAAVGSERLNEHRRAGRCGSRQCRRKVRDLVAVGFPAKGKRQMATTSGNCATWETVTLHKG